MRISDWSSDVCSSDLRRGPAPPEQGLVAGAVRQGRNMVPWHLARDGRSAGDRRPPPQILRFRDDRSEEHTSELQPLMRISYAVFCLKKKKPYIQNSCRSMQKTTAINKITIK